MTREDELWADAIDQLERQRKPGDRNWLNFLNRMFQERIGDAGLKVVPIPMLRRENCSIGEETWTVRDLFEAATLRHARANPAFERRPVFVRFARKLLVIDGNNRVVKWARERGSSTCAIIVLQHPPVPSTQTPATA